MRLIIGTVLALVLTVASSLADPAGTYRVSGTNPGSGSTYSGTVTVKRNGDTFLLAWTIAGNRQIGVGIGKDDFIAVSYRSGDSIGIAFYRADENSGWEGIWAPLGGQTLGTEKWPGVRHISPRNNDFVTHRDHTIASHDRGFTMSLG